VTPEQHRYVYTQSSVGGGIVNVLLNGFLGWLATLGVSEFPTWKIPGVGPDILATAFGVSFGTCIGVVLQVHLDLKKGKTTVPEVSPALGARIARLPRSLWVRAFAVGAVAAVVFAPPVLVALGFAAPVSMSRTNFIVLKAVFAGIEAAIVTPFLVLAALLDTARRAPAPAAVPASD
jgi:hypothetical protein